MVFLAPTYNWHDGPGKPPRLHGRKASGRVNAELDKSLANSAGAEESEMILTPTERHAIRRALGLGDYARTAYKASYLPPPADLPMWRDMVRRGLVWERDPPLYPARPLFHVGSRAALAVLREGERIASDVRVTMVQNIDPMLLVGKRRREKCST